MRIWRLTLAIIMMAIVCAGVCSAYNPGDPEFRAIYVNAWNEGLKNASQIDQLIAHAHYCNANTIVAQVRRRGDTIYPSGEPTATGFSSSFDSLADLVQKCHSTSPRLDVQAWFVVWPVASEGAVPSNPNSPYVRYPQYLTKTDTGGTNIGGDFWFDPGNPNAEQYTYNVMMDVVNRYDVDGINFDYIRYGYYDAGYNDVSVARFNARYGRSGQPGFMDSVWSDWRREQVTNFVRKVYANAIAVKPSIKVTADCIAGSPAPSDLNDFILHSQAYTKNFQHWPGWMFEGILDMDIPMTYFDCAGQYGGLFDPWVCFTRNYAYNRQCAVAPGVYSPSCLTTQLDHTRSLACGATNGAAIYAYSSMDTSMMNAARAVWTTPAPVPTMPWKSAPTKGHIKGNVTFAGSVWIDGATITLTGPGVNRSMYADGTGFFAFIDLPHATYSVTCVATGYGTVTTNNIHVDVGQVVDVPCNYPISTLIISNVQAGSETPTGATVTWTTNAAASSKVYYGLDRTCSSSTTEDSTQVTPHSVLLSGLSPATTYYYRVYSKYSESQVAMSPVYALVTIPAFVADFIVESRSPGHNYGNFSFDGPTTSTVKSTVSGLTGTGCYYAGQTTPPKWGQWSYTPTVSGTYKVSATWGTNTFASGVPAPTWTVYNAGAPVTVSISQTAGQNGWNLLTSSAGVQLNSGVAYPVRLATNPDDVSGKRTYFDSVKWAWAAPVDSMAPSTPASLTATSVQDDMINLGWTASSDNVGVAGYRILRSLSSTELVSVIDSSPTNSYTDHDILPNTKYYYAVSAYDTSGNKSANSATINTWSLTAVPSSATVTCDKQAGVWQTAGPFTFTSFAWGPGKVNYYMCAWDTSPSHTWNGSESYWFSGTKACSATSSASPYYLHIRGYNQSNVAGDPADLGPYYLDSTAPDTPIVTDDGAYSPSQTSVHASWSANDPESPIIGYQYAVGTTSGGVNLVNWTTTTDTSATITFPSQSYGTMIYVSVKAGNASLLWSGAGNSDGIKVAQPVASIAEAKSLGDSGTTPIYLSNRTVSAVLSDCFYVQDPESNKLSGIRAQGACPYAVGTSVNVGGYLGTTSAKERTITSASVTLAP